MVFIMDWYGLCSLFWDTAMKTTAKASTLALTVLMLAVTSGCAGTRPAEYARPLTHFFKVDQGLYRGGQPTPEGVRRLADLCVRTVVNLRAQGDARRADERRVVESLGMRWVSLPMRSYWRPTDAQITTFLDLTADPNARPVFVHCQQGEDRTGAMIAIYRIARQDWTPERAYAEALALGLADWSPFMRRVILHEAERNGLQQSAQAVSP